MKLRNKKAVALRYDGDSAPKVTAKGSGVVAAAIIKAARAHNIPMQENHVLTELLSQVELNHEIPEALYTAVAQLLAFIYHLNQKKPNQ